MQPHLCSGPVGWWMWRGGTALFQGFPVGLCVVKPNNQGWARRVTGAMWMERKEISFSRFSHKLSTVFIWKKYSEKSFGVRVGEEQMRGAVLSLLRGLSASLGVLADPLLYPGVILDGAAP